MFMVNAAPKQAKGTVHDAVEGYYLETVEGLYFAVKGLEHPPDRWIAVLRYAPDPETGDREKDGVPYRRLYRFEEQERWIGGKYPHYREYDPVFGALLQSVPRASVRRIYSPHLQYQKLKRHSRRNALEDAVVDFLEKLHHKAGVPRSALGITGSVLIGMHTNDSDIDAVVFGEKNCRRVHGALHQLLDDENETELKRLDAEGLEKLYAQRVVDTKMDFREFAELERRKANQGCFRGRTWFVRFVRKTGEIGESYASCFYKALGRTSIHASIERDNDAIFTPCRYPLTAVKNVGGDQKPEPGEIISFRGRFCEQARCGDRVVATGTLERVRERRGKLRHRLLLGNSPEDTMIVLR
jgi:predicted nucleotidyltransferase